MILVYFSVPDPLPILTLRICILDPDLDPAHSTSVVNKHNFLIDQITGKKFLLGQIKPIDDHWAKIGARRLRTINLIT
jgi:hypothetical protein